jgi:deoxyribonuclease V
MPKPRNLHAPEICEGARLHAWNLTPKEAIQIQQELRSRVIAEPLEDQSITLVAGVDVGLPRGAKIARAAITVLDYDSMELVDHAVTEAPVPFPYVPGLLSFREMPIILETLGVLNSQPDIFIVDGQGYAHPRRFGLACHLGVWLDKPAIGCGKSILTGEHKTLPSSRGSVAPLIDDGETVGAAVRTRKGVNPVYISIGHRIDLDSAVRVILNCGRGVRLPEPTRLAHRLASGKM